MGLPLKTFVARIVAVPVVAVVASVAGAITSSWWAAALMGFVGTLLFTFMSERVLREKLFGKLGSSPMAWYTVHLLGETAVVALIAALFHFVAGASVANGTYFIVAALIIWVAFCYEMIGKIFGLLPFWLQTRGRR